VNLPSGTDINAYLYFRAAVIVIAIAAVAASAVGCATTPKTPRRLIPVELPKDSLIKGYRVEGMTSIIETDLFKITLRIVTEEERSLPPLLRSMVEKHYTFFHLKVENRGKKKLRFNPQFAHISGNDGYYSRTVGFAQIYELVAGVGAEMEKSLEGERALRTLKGTYYDSPVYVKPGVAVARFLIFDPLSENTTQAEMVIDELTHGNELLAIRFPFSTKVGEKRKKEIGSAY
jgi:hypothetical protein